MPPGLARRGISARLIVYILLFSSAITLLATGLQLYLDYSHDVHLLHERMTEIRDSYVKSISSSVWAMDREHVQLQIEGIHALPDMQYLEIRVDGEVLAAAGRAGAQKVIAEEFPLRYRYNGRDLTLGRLRAEASLDGIYRRLLDKALVILGSQAVKTFLVSAFMLLIFQYLVTRHLARMAGFARAFSMDSLDRPLALDRRPRRGAEADELDDVVVALNDMRERLARSCRELEAEHEKRVQAERLACVGELSAAIAHEIRNPLSSVINAVELLSREGLAAGERREVREIVNSESLRLQRILTEFLEYSRQGPPQMRDHDLMGLLRSVLKSLEMDGERLRAVELRTDYHAPRCLAHYDPDKISQVLWNLLLNAVQAMPAGGVLSIATRLAGGRVEVHIADTGAGIPQALRTRVTEPFVTGRHDGTGLGLCVACRILADHGSDLTILSGEPRGTEVRFSLTLAEPACAAS